MVCSFKVQNAGLLFLDFNNGSIKLDTALPCMTHTSLGIQYQYLSICWPCGVTVTFIVCQCQMPNAKMFPYQLNAMQMLWLLTFDLNLNQRMRSKTGTKQCQEPLMKRKKHLCREFTPYTDRPVLGVDLNLNVEFPWTLTTEQLNSFEH